MVRGMRQRSRRAQCGMTLMEVLIGTGLGVGGGGALLMGMHSAFIFVDYLREQQVVMNAAEAQLAELARHDFDELATNGTLASARAPSGQVACIGEDENCNGTLDTVYTWGGLGGDLAGEVDANGNGVADRLTTGGLNIRIRPVTRADGTAETFNNATMLDIHVAASWRFRGRCIGGEDRNCNSVLDAGEDINGNGWLDTPVMVSTRVARQR